VEGVGRQQVATPKDGINQLVQVANIGIAQGAERCEHLADSFCVLACKLQVGLKRRRRDICRAQSGSL
jgi:hypothetical protein